MDVCPGARRVPTTLARGRRSVERTEHPHSRSSSRVFGRPTGSAPSGRRRRGALSSAFRLGGPVGNGRRGRPSPGGTTPLRPVPPRRVGIGVALWGRARANDCRHRRVRGRFRGHAPPGRRLALQAGAAVGRDHGGDSVGLLYYHGLSLEVIGRFFGVHKTTEMRWLSSLAQVNWQAAVQHSQRFFSGIVAVDEKWIKIAGGWEYLFVAVDHVSGFPLHVALLPSNATPFARSFC